MEVILREDVQHLGAAGDVVKVKDGLRAQLPAAEGPRLPGDDANKKKIAYEAERIAKQRAAGEGRRRNRGHPHRRGPLSFHGEGG